MARNTALSSDIDFIKEFEELKIKQRILIETLKRKSLDQRSKELEEILTKLDFLVTIFQQANEESAQKGEDDGKDPMTKRLDEIDKKLADMNQKLTDLPRQVVFKMPGEDGEEQKMVDDVNDAEKAVEDSKNPSQPPPADLGLKKDEKKEDGKGANYEDKINQALQPSLGGKSDSENKPPTPNFVVDDNKEGKPEEDKRDAATKAKEEEDAKERKKWFK